MHDAFRTIFRTLLTIIVAFLCTQSILGQAACLSGDEVKSMAAQVTSHPKVAFNQKLSEQLIKLKRQNDEHLQRDVAENKKPAELIKGMKADRAKNAAEICQIFKTFGWPSKDLVGQEAVDDAFFLVRDSASGQMQIELLPVVIAAAKEGEVSQPSLAAFIDRLRLRVGLKQLFGTQASIINGFLVLYPITAEAQVDARRKEFGLPPLAGYLRALEQDYRLPLVKSTGALTNSFSDSVKDSVATTTASGLFKAETVGENDVVRIETNLVNLNVSVYSNKLRTQVSKLEQKDFAVTEDGLSETISYFGTTEMPFDLVLLLDLSASTTGKRDLIRKSTRRFIEAARPADRLAVVTFSNEAHVVSPLTEDRTQLLTSIDKIEGTGNSAIWESLKFTLDRVLGPKTLGRRRAVVIMTDGIDNSLGGYAESRVSFADLVEAVRRHDALIIPIYLDMKNSFHGRFRGPGDRVLENGRNTLELLADESGGLFYQAQKIEDLEGVYVQVIEDLGKVYSLGYRPANERHDGSWRTVKIAIPNHPELQARARPGYYAN